MADNHFTVVGIDGCPAGWLCVHVVGGDFTPEVFPNIEDAWSRFQTAQLILIDVPIGLREQGTEQRACETLARGLLGTRHVCVFTPPMRSTLHCSSFEDACEHNFRICGRKLSRQSWAIAPKIAEVDQFIRRTPSARGVLRETHPEVCFWALNGGHPIQPGKKTRAGREARRMLLEQFIPTIAHVRARVRREYKVSEVADDDLHDALVTALTAQFAVNGFGAVLPSGLEVDDQGLRMEMVYPLLASTGGEHRTAQQPEGPRLQSVVGALDAVDRRRTARSSRLGTENLSATDGTSSPTRPFDPDRFRPLEHVLDPDPRSHAFARFDPNAQGFRQLTLADFHEDVASLQLVEGVPEDIAVMFDTARNLYLCAYYYYRFFPVAEHHALTCLEYALRRRFRDEISANQYALRPKHLTLAPLLRYAVEQGHLRNDGFKTWRQHVEAQSRDRHLFDKIKEMSKFGLTEMVFDEDKIEVNDDDRAWNYVEILQRAIPGIRNDYAHGSGSLHRGAAHTLEIVSECINQIYAPANSSSDR